LKVVDRSSVTAVSNRTESGLSGITYMGAEEATRQ
jgi:hypothetical protein